MTPPRRQFVEPGVLPRHRHETGYVAVVLAGAYEEAGDNGRRRLGPGDVVAHQAWEAHLNRTPGSGARVLNLPLPGAALPPFGRLVDLDGWLRALERGPAEAEALLANQVDPADRPAADWPDLLAQGLAAGDRRSLSDWARAFGVSREHLSRGFRQVFGTTPKRFRWDARNRAALRSLQDADAPLAELALAHGFADQAHMTRSLRAFSGVTPAAWRRSNGFKTPS